MKREENESISADRVPFFFCFLICGKLKVMSYKA